VLSMLLLAVAGKGWFYWVSISSILLVLALSANTAFADFPRLCRIVAQNGYLPYAFSIRGRMNLVCAVRSCDRSSIFQLQERDKAGVDFLHRHAYSWQTVWSGLVIGSRSARARRSPAADKTRCSFTGASLRCWCRCGVLTILRPTFQITNQQTQNTLFQHGLPTRMHL